MSLFHSDAKRVANNVVNDFIILVVNSFGNVVLFFGKEIKNVHSVHSAAGLSIGNQIYNEDKQNIITKNRADGADSAMVIEAIETITGKKITDKTDFYQNLIKDNNNEYTLFVYKKEQGKKIDNNDFSCGNKLLIEKRNDYKSDSERIFINFVEPVFKKMIDGISSIKDFSSSDTINKINGNFFDELLSFIDDPKK